MSRMSQKRYPRRCVQIEEFHAAFSMLGQLDRARFTTTMRIIQQPYALLSALCVNSLGRRILSVFQPHTYSRTVAMRREFSEVLSLADRVIIAPVYNIRAESESGGSHQTCGEEISSLIGNKSICINSFRDILHQVLLEVHVRGIGQNEKSNTGSMASTGCVSIDQDHCRTVLVTMGAGTQ